MSSSGFWRAGAFLLLLTASSVQASTPEIALLLPQSGRMAKAAEAIRNGFLAAYYQDSNGAAGTPSLHFYDSDAADPVELVQQAARNGASLIIGPLDRERLDALLKLPSLPVPVLALNTTDGQADNLFKFALAPEDETQRLVEWMEMQQIRNPLILMTADDASDRQAKIFQAAWAINHTEPLQLTAIDPTRRGGVAAAIRELVRIDSKHDAIFLATPSLARQVQPALTYYHSKLTLYAPSSAWDPTADASGQNDLNGMKFCDVPWMLEDAKAEQAALYETFGRPVSGYDRLFAFGADAWTLARQWQAMLDGEKLHLRSGLSQLDATHYLHRIPTCAEISNGSAHVLWSPDPITTPGGSS